MKCPKCESTQLRKNGRSSGKQRYLCKACGKQFLEPLSLPQLSRSESETVEVASNRNKDKEDKEDKRDKGDKGDKEDKGEKVLCTIATSYETASQIETSSPTHLITPALNNSSAIPTNLQQQKATWNPSTQGIAILLLDAENLKLDINAEKFLAGLCNYPLQIKIAFANWRNHSIGKQDAELYERGYQLIHVPGGSNSADAQMIARGVSISRHYPDVKEVFVCSSDWLLTNLCNELQSQGIIVYRVRRQDNSLSVENRSTGENRQYSLTIGTEIPSFEKFVDKIEELINAEHASINERLAQLSTVAALFQERRHLTLNGHHSNNVSPITAQNQDSHLPVAEPESTLPNLERVEVELDTSVTTLSGPSIKNINSKEEFEQTLVEIITSMKANSPANKISVTKLSAALQIICGETANSVIKKLKLGGNFTKFLQSCTTFKIEKTGTNAEVNLSQTSSLK